MTSPSNAELIQRAALLLTGEGHTPFSRIEVFRRIWQRYPERRRPSLDPTFQGMIRNAPGGPQPELGAPLSRVDHGLYVLR